jgi:LysR family transcriptional regulator, nod-box dependent transcriptional activator
MILINNGDVLSMRLRQLDLNLLVVLDILLSEQSVARTAERLNVTQPAVSNSLARLRTHFEDELLVRTGRRMILTQLAENMKDPVRHVILELQTIAELRADFDPNMASREFTIAASDYASVTFLCGVTRLLERAGAQMRLKILPLTNANISLFGRGEIDFLLLPGSVAIDDQFRQTLFRETYTCIARQDSSEIGSRIDLETYLSRSHVVGSIDTDERLIAHEEDYLMKNGIERNVAIVTPGFAQLPYFVVGTGYIATVHRRLAEQACKTLPLKIVEPEFSLPEITLQLQWHAARNADIANVWLRDTIGDFAAGY